MLSNLKKRIFFKMNISEFYRAPLYLELHRFKYADHETNVDRGFDLKSAEARSLTALTKLLAKTNYQGNEPKERISLKDWIILGESPVLSFTWSEYFNAYYEARSEAKVLGSNQKKRAKDALFALCEKNLKLSYYRLRGEPTINAEGKLIQDKSGTFGSKRNVMSLAFHPIFIDNISTFFVLKPLDIYNQICNQLKCQKPKKQVILFIEWLLTKNHARSPILKENLIKRLWLEPLLAARKTSRIEETLQECFQVAFGLGLLKEFPTPESAISKKNSEKFIFRLNADLCRRAHVRFRYSVRPH
jgi:hypothetical protein